MGVMIHLKSRLHLYRLHIFKGAIKYGVHQGRFMSLELIVVHIETAQVLKVIVGNIFETFLKYFFVSNGE